ncbi:transglycosylase domain-containing protein [Pseudobacteriovorax antillogorgiicola]|uniref:peptidoglycan glycosyltransferase n=1 Tax=Pseudobacteriovorax antillogorgiicola TaxID=1513793 RepID=A0A1Y6BE70_9BACT|nr:transglycosylase domain-containing protein [Pseudobacteriovorax antillogorgiicola]TCS58603.1 penicillin binding protein [Pseudobacteriovorax antillogorgiicola]SME96974.1 Penicillin binding protein transpeptidase domain-containing protein [Pseudobacteriovorax antillogorgiicola]
MENVKKYSLYALLLVTVAGFSAGLGVISVVVFQVYFGDVSELKKSTILARINEETTIYTLNEEQKLGSFFNESHRSYVPIDEIPTHMIRAMVASEDKNYYNHSGVDPIAISKAFWEGVSSGLRFRRGGSTITQQTVKNILDRREHTFKRKFKEMIRALQLERMYSKEQILEFYLNQFHVTANGKGIGIAAKYYFNKDVQDINLIEGAFIAGSVKAPSKYNPFIKYTKAKRDKALLEANRRKNYVLRRMYEQGWISEAELKDAWDQPVPFNRGKFRTREVALVSLVRGQLDKKEILDALGMDSIQELNHAGLRIYTTIDKKMQDVAQLAMRRNLSRLETILQGYRVEDPELFKPLRSLEVNQFYYAKVDKIVKGKDPKIFVDFGLPKGVVPSKSLIRTAKILNLPTYKGYKFHLDEILNTTKVGDIIFVEVMSYDKDTNQAVLEIKKRPSINGGLISVDKGEVRSVVAGFDNKGYNRAMFAARQPGSVFKSVVYFAALQLGWSVLDQLDNERRLFSIQGTYYFPRPDHKSPYKDVSLLWAGVKSENLATIYLTKNLLSKLNFDEFKTLLGSSGLLPEDDEAPRDYHYRVAKETGVQLDNSGIKEYLLGRTIEDMKPDLVFSGRLSLLRDLSKLWWGRGYLAELQNLYLIEPDEISNRERATRINLLKRNYERMGVLARSAREDWDRLGQEIQRIGPEGVFMDEALTTILSRFRVMSSSSRPTLGYVRELPGEEYVPTKPDEEITLQPPPGRSLNPLDVQAIWGGMDSLGGQSNIQLDDILLDAYLPLKYYEKIRAGVEDRYRLVMTQKDKYSLYQYFHHHDFKIAVGLKYLVDLGRAMGVYSRLEPVLSYGLGTNEVSVAEVAKVYQTFKSGKIYRFFEEGPQNQLNFVRRIEDRDGNVLWEAKKEEFQLVDPCYAAQMGEILRKVVTHGTGRRARGELYLDLSEVAGISAGQRKGKIRIPAYGKTGTTNDYTTAYFAGYVPYPSSARAALDPMEGANVIASYVGYDLNQTMQRGPFRISGAMGALPVWTDYAKGLLKVQEYGEYLDKFDLNLISRQVWPLKFHECTSGTKVDLPRGTIIRASNQGDSESFGFTNFAKDGETFMNEFARTRSINSYVQIAMKSDERGRSPRRMFQPFLKEDTEASEPKDVSGDPEYSDDGEMDEGDELELSPSPDDTDSGLGSSSIPQEARVTPTPAPAPLPRTSDKPANEEESDSEGRLEDDELW